MHIVFGVLRINFLPFPFLNKYFVYRKSITLHIRFDEYNIIYSIFMKLKFILLLLISFRVVYLTAQEDEDPCVQTMDKSVEKEFKKAREYHQKGNKTEAYKIYYEILMNFR